MSKQNMDTHPLFFYTDKRKNQHGWTKFSGHSHNQQ